MEIGREQLRLIASEDRSEKPACQDANSRSFAAAWRSRDGGPKWVRNHADSQDTSASLASHMRPTWAITPSSVKAWGRRTADPAGRQTCSLDDDGRRDATAIRGSGRCGDSAHMTEPRAPPARQGRAEIVSRPQPPPLILRPSNEHAYRRLRGHCSGEATRSDSDRMTPFRGACQQATDPERAVQVLVAVHAM